MDLDDTLVYGNTGVAFVIRVLYYGIKGGLPRSFYFRALLYFWALPLYFFRFLRPVYMFLQRLSAGLFYDLERSWSETLVKKALRSTLQWVKIPQFSKEFVRKLKQRGYRVVIVSASPQVVVDALLPYIGADEGYGISSRWSLIFDAEGKEQLLRQVVGVEQVDLMVGNPGREPFWMAKEAIVVRSPKELNSWLPRL